MKSILLRPLLGAIAFTAMMTSVAPVSAALVTFTDPMSGFSYDSDTQSAAFNAALGNGYTHLIFQNASNTDGASYSSDVTFSTAIGTFGGSNTGKVNASGEIGPYGNWDGTLNIDFLANGNTVSSVGFGLVVFNTPVEQIRVFDETNTLIGIFNNQLSDTFSLWGVAGTAGERIGRIELDGNFFAIQDTAYNRLASNTVPEPAGVLLFGIGFLAFAASRRKSAKSKNV